MHNNCGDVNTIRVRKDLTIYLLRHLIFLILFCHFPLIYLHYALPKSFSFTEELCFQSNTSGSFNKNNSESHSSFEQSLRTLVLHQDVHLRRHWDPKSSHFQWIILDSIQHLWNYAYSIPWSDLIKLDFVPNVWSNITNVLTLRIFLSALSCSMFGIWTGQRLLQTKPPKDNLILLKMMPKSFSS